MNKELATWQELKHITDNWGLCLQYSKIDPRRTINLKALCRDVIDPEVLINMNFDGSRDKALTELLVKVGIEVETIETNDLL